MKSIASLAALGLLPALAAAQQRPLVIEHGVYQEIGRAHV